MILVEKIRLFYQEIQGTLKTVQQLEQMSHCVHSMRVPLHLLCIMIAEVSSSFWSTKHMNLVPEL